MAEIQLHLSGCKAFDHSRLLEIESILNVSDVDFFLDGKIIIFEDDNFQSAKEYPRDQTIETLEPYIIKKSTSHYDWLQENLNDFWLKVFDKNLDESGFGGVISAHGDKAYGYKNKWVNAGIPFNHGVAMFFLTYTDIVDEEVDTCQWVIDNYFKFKPLLNKNY